MPAKRSAEALGRRLLRRPLARAELDAISRRLATRRVPKGSAKAPCASSRRCSRTRSFSIGSNALRTTRADGSSAAVRIALGARLAAVVPVLGLGAGPLAARCAASNTLATRADVEREARRLVADERAKRGLFHFYLQWLKLSDFALVEKDRVLFTRWDDALRDELGRETTRFLEAMLWEDDARFETLMTAPYTFANAVLSDFYELPIDNPDQTELVRKDFGAGRAASRPLDARVDPLDAGEGESDRSDPPRKIHPHAVLLHRAPAAAARSRGVAARARSAKDDARAFRQHRADDRAPDATTCSIPVGLLFEHYDAIGRYREPKTACRSTRRATSATPTLSTRSTACPSSPSGSRKAPKCGAASSSSGSATRSGAAKPKPTPARSTSSRTCSEDERGPERAPRRAHADRSVPARDAGPRNARRGTMTERRTTMERAATANAPAASARRAFRSPRMLHAVVAGAVGLPWLETFAGKTASAALAVPKRFVAMFSPNGTDVRSLGAERQARRTSRSRRFSAARAAPERSRDVAGVDQKGAGGDGHQNGIGGMLTGGGLLPGRFAGVGAPPAGWCERSVGRSAHRRRDRARPAVSLARTRRAEGAADNWGRMCYRGRNQPLPPREDPARPFDDVFGAACSIPPSASARRAAASRSSTRVAGEFERCRAKSGPPIGSGSSALDLPARGRARLNAERGHDECALPGRPGTPPDQRSVPGKWRRCRWI